MIELRCKGHSSEYELSHLIHLFNPYIEKEYLLEASYEEALIKVQLFSDESQVVTATHQLEESQDQVIHKRNIKEALKRATYEILIELTGKQMPWGILTGIRPTKIVHEYLEQQMSDQGVASILENDYRISRHKVALLIEIAKQELDILRQNKKDQINLYIGIPFCPTRCVYCSFTAYSIVQKADLVDVYLKALYKEIDYIAQAKKNMPIRSLYIGGGTPTSLSETQLFHLLTHVKKSFDLDKIEEYTVEAGRPDTITEEKLRIMKDLGVSRISINPQTMNQKTLDTIGRKHTVEDIEKVLHLARKVGHQNINMDIIVGLPGEGISEVQNTLAKLSLLKPDNITVHTLAIKRASRIREEKITYDLTKADNIEQMLALCEKHIRSMGLKPYYMYRQKNMLGNFENVGYAKPGMACIYNIEIMEEKQTIVALGAGGITKIIHQNGERIDRVVNVKSLEDYITRIDEMIARKELGFMKYQ